MLSTELRCLASSSLWLHAAQLFQNSLSLTPPDTIHLKHFRIVYGSMISCNVSWEVCLQYHHGVDTRYQSQSLAAILLHVHTVPTQVLFQHRSVMATLTTSSQCLQALVHTHPHTWCLAVQMGIRNNALNAGNDVCMLSRSLRRRGLWNAALELLKRNDSLSTARYDTALER
eukprot:PhF_6_TR20848/c0_g1_i3/m.30040